MIIKRFKKFSILIGTLLFALNFTIVSPVYAQESDITQSDTFETVDVSNYQLIESEDSLVNLAQNLDMDVFTFVEEHELNTQSRGSQSNSTIERNVHTYFAPKGFNNSHTANHDIVYTATLTTTVVYNTSVSENVTYYKLVSASGSVHSIGGGTTIVSQEVRLVNQGSSLGGPGPSEAGPYYCYNLDWSYNAPSTFKPVNSRALHAVGVWVKVNCRRASGTFSGTATNYM